MPVLRPEEAFAAALMEDTLEVPVGQYDDGSLPGMYDLDVLYPDRPSAAAEVVRAADEDATALSQTSKKVWQSDGLVGGWIACITPAPRRWKQLREELPRFLSELEHRGINELTERQLSEKPIEAATKLGIVSLTQSPTSLPGSIYPQVEHSSDRTGGFLSATGNELADWISEFLLHPGQRDVRDKLGRSGASERHAFVILPAFCTAPFEVFDLLTTEDPPIPDHAPTLPSEITDVWVASVWDAGKGFRYSAGGGWSAFDKRAGRGDVDGVGHGV